MNDKNKRQVVKADRGLFRNIAFQIKLIWRLVADPRINPLLKLIPIGTMVYFIFPDLLPGPVDDAMVIGAGTYLFVELCPPEIVAEHREALEKEINGVWKPSADENPEKIDEDNIVDGEYREE